MNKYKLLVLIGPSGSGKDRIRNLLLNCYGGIYHNVVLSTTRPMREGERDGDPYWFIDAETAAIEVLNPQTLTAQRFNDWFYILSLNEFNKDKINLCVLAPSAIENLIDHPNIDLHIMKISTSDKTRLLRCLEREKEPDCDEICRRFIQDKKDFDDTDIYDYDSFSFFDNEGILDPVRTHNHIMYNRADWFKPINLQ